MKGRIVRVAGPVVGVTGLEAVRLYDVVLVGELGLIGEVIRLSGDIATVQVYEETSGLRVGDTVQTTGKPLVAHLGPGLLGQVYDGLQRPLRELVNQTGDFIQRGVTAPPLPEHKRWRFTAQVRSGDQVGPVDVLGVVPESKTIEHRVMTPPGVQGRVVEVNEGELLINDVVVIIETDAGDRQTVTLVQRWPVRWPRPIQTRLDPTEPLMTGTRIIDTFFPVAKGGSAIVPGGFGTGKTVVQHSLARWSDVDVVVYVGCGERGNEMTEVLIEFPELEDPRTGAPLMDRTVLIANTSNMPVAAREASIYTGITIAEYYRDMGYDVLMLADSTSRWGEALREISGRLEEMPGEEGYPAYLGARLSEFYERAGRVQRVNVPQNGSKEPARVGSVTVVGAVSPPGGDFSEPVTQNSMRVAGTFWALDYDLSRRRHFPAISWTRSYSLYQTGPTETQWRELTRDAMALLQREVELQDIVKLVGTEALSESELLVLFIARMLREDFLQQSAYDVIDRFCPMCKAYWMLEIIMAFYHRAQAAQKAGVSLERLIELPVVAEIAHMKEIPADEAEPRMAAIKEQLERDFAGIR